jgi:hypothetical protein
MIAVSRWWLASLTPDLLTYTDPGLITTQDRFFAVGTGDNRPAEPFFNVHLSNPNGASSGKCGNKHELV